MSETSTGVSVPPLALAYQHASGPTLRATVALCFLIGELVSLLVLALGAAIEPQHLRQAAILLAPLAPGAWASMFIHHRLDGPLVRIVVLAFSIISGLVVVLRAW